jgi:hypothetical protein
VRLQLMYLCLSTVCSSLRLFPAPHSGEVAEPRCDDTCLHSGADQQELCNVVTAVHAHSCQRFACRRYGESLGDPELRELIAKKLYPTCDVKASDVIVSDGSKCDIGRLQMMFGQGVTVAAQVRLATNSGRSPLFVLPICPASCQGAEVHLALRGCLAWLCKCALKGPLSAHGPTHGGHA